MGRAKSRRNIALSPAYPDEKVEANNFLRNGGWLTFCNIFKDYLIEFFTYKYRTPQTVHSPGFPYDSGIFPIPLGLIGDSGNIVSRPNRCTSASIC